MVTIERAGRRIKRNQPPKTEIVGAQVVAYTAAFNSTSMPPAAWSCCRAMMPPTFNFWFMVARIFIHFLWLNPIIRCIQSTFCAVVFAIAFAFAFACSCVCVRACVDARFELISEWSSFALCVK